MPGVTVLQVQEVRAFADAGGVKFSPENVGDRVLAVAVVP